MAKIILECIKEHIEDFMDRKHVGYHFGSSSIEYIITVRFILEQCPQFRSPLHLFFINFVKAVNWMNMKSIWSPQLRGRVVLLCKN